MQLEIQPAEEEKEWSCVYAEMLRVEAPEKPLLCYHKDVLIPAVPLERRESLYSRYNALSKCKQALFLSCLEQSSRCHFNLVLCTFLSVQGSVPPGNGSCAGAAALASKCRWAYGFKRAFALRIISCVV